MKRKRWGVILCAAAAPFGEARAARAEPYTLRLTLQGLVGYVNTPGEVWALLPDASPGADLPPGGVSENSYPRHFAYLRIPGREVEGVGGGDELLIPLKGYDVVPELAFAGGEGLPAEPFRQPANDAVDVLDPRVLDSPGEVRGLASRVRLPRGGLKVLETKEGDEEFEFGRVNPRQAPNGCIDPGPPLRGDGARVAGVLWETSLSAPLVLGFLHHRDSQKNFRITVRPAPGSSEVTLEVVNQVSRALVEVDFHDAHWEPYRWYYSLVADPSDCTRHYYPVPPVAGGKRCPQKLYDPGQ